MVSTFEESTVETHPCRVDGRQSCLQTLARKALRECGYRQLGRLECDVTEDVAILSGEVPSYFLKQIAQTVILRLDAFSAIENRVQVHEA